MVECFDSSSQVMPKVAWDLDRADNTDDHFCVSWGIIFFAVNVILTQIIVDILYFYAKFHIAKIDLLHH